MEEPPFLPKRTHLATTVGTSTLNIFTWPQALIRSSHLPQAHVPLGQDVADPWLKSLFQQRLIDDMSLSEDSDPSGNPTVFTDYLVTKLQEYYPGTIRYWARSSGPACRARRPMNLQDVPMAISQRMTR